MTDLRPRAAPAKSSYYRMESGRRKEGRETGANQRQRRYHGQYCGRSKELFLDAVIQQTFIEVNEEGTTAGAVLANYFKLLAEGDEPPKFRADHPFLFLIRDNHSGSILFLGRVNDPSS